MLSSTKSLFAGKSFLQILLLHLLITQICFAQWFWQNPLPQGNGLSSVKFISSSVGWAVGDYGTILKTTDGGTTWTFQSSGTTNYLGSVFFTDANNGTVVGSDGTILRTLDGGQNWISQSSGTTHGITGVWFTDANTGTAVASDMSNHLGLILRTTNGGTAWILQSSVTTNGLIGVCFTDANTGTVMDLEGTILRTTDGGQDWISQPSTITRTISGFCFTDANNGWAVGGWGQDGDNILKTTNGGATWTSSYSSAPYTIPREVSFSDANNGIVVGVAYDLHYNPSGLILRTTNGGQNWVRQTNNANYELYGISFTDSNRGWIVGGGGTILGTTNGGQSWVSQTNGTRNRLDDVFFTDTNNGWAVGDSSWVAGDTVGSRGILLHTTNAGQQWILQPTWISGSLTKVFFLNSDIGWVVGGLGTILKTTNGGIDWLQQSISTQPYLHSIYFINPDNGWVVGDSSSYSGGIIYNTTDGGTSWSEQAGVTGVYVLNDICFKDSNIGVTGGTEGGRVTGGADGGSGGNWGKIFQTTNGGYSWTVQYDGISVQGVDYFGASVWVAVGYWSSPKGGPMLILRSTDDGVTWQTVLEVTDSRKFCDVAFTDETNGWAVGDGGIIYGTTDGGITWIQLASGTYCDLFSVSFTDANNGTVVGANGTILRTTNGGNPVPVELNSFTATANGKEVVLNWSTATELNNQGFEVQRKFGINDFVTIGSVKGNGTTTSANNYTYVDKLTDAGKYFYRLKQIDYGGKYEYSQTVEVNWSPFTTYKLEQNFSNPFNPTTTIGFGIPEKGNVRLSVLNILGEEIKVLLSEEKEAGYHSIDFNASDLPSGVYFYQLKAGEYLQTKKMILLK